MHHQPVRPPQQSASSSTKRASVDKATAFLIRLAPSVSNAQIGDLGEKELLKFDYRKGIAGSVFTTGVSLNIDTKSISNDDPF
jgi:Nif-specific regulatory protein